MRDFMRAAPEVGGSILALLYLAVQRIACSTRWLGRRLLELRRHQSQIEHALLADVGNWMRVVDFSHSPQCEGYAARRFENLGSQFTDVIVASVLDDQLGVHHQRRQGVAYLVRSGQCGIAELAKGLRISIALRAPRWRDGFDLDDEVNELR